MSDRTTTAVIALGCVAVLYIVRRALQSRPPCPLPPGPPGLPWVGNVTGIDTSAPWKTCAEWGRTYGDIIRIRLMGKDIIIINSEKVAKDLLESRSKNYADRPYLVTNEMCGVDFHSAFLPYGDRWRLHRRFFHQTFRLDAAPRFIPVQHRNACHFLRYLFNTPEQLGEHVFDYTASVILNSTYNYEPASQKDELIEMVRKVLDLTVVAIRPDVGILAGAFPFLFRLPSWFPGMSFKKQMDMTRVFIRQYLDLPFEHFLKKGPSDIVLPSMLYDALHDAEEKDDSREEWWMTVLKEASGSAFIAASDTSNSVLMTFFLMMVLNPDVQEKAQAQIDEVVGKDRLPSIDDRPLLPLVDAIFWETLRYNPVLPLSIPHATMEDDIYRGFYIPKGATVMVNLWAMAHDESKYPNPHAFMPERFLGDDGSLKPNDVEHVAFGFGRRICVGRHFADTSVWTVIAKVLTVFKILKSVDENGVEIPVEAKFSSGIVIQPVPFKCKIVPRVPGMDGQKLEQLITTSTA